MHARAVSFLVLLLASSGYAAQAPPVRAVPNTDNCDGNATCSNTSGGFTCTCNGGYVGDGVLCGVPQTSAPTISAGGLMWEKKTGTLGALSACPGGPNCSDPRNVNNTYTWAVLYSPDGTAFTEFLARLNQPGNCYAGYCDWRLPTKTEMAALTWPAAGEFLPDSAVQHWTGSSYDLSRAWVTQTAENGGYPAGYQYIQGKNSSFSVRAVRALP